MLKALLSRVYAAVPPKLVATLLRRLHRRFSASVVGAFFTPDGKVLVLRHVYRHSYPWGLPAGFLNVGENPEAGALRELKEETGLVATISGLVSITSITSRHLEIAFHGTIDPTQTPRLNHEIFEIAYCDVAALPTAMPSEQRRLVAALASSRVAL